jgi:hypothetical protein
MRISLTGAYAVCLKAGKIKAAVNTPKVNNPNKPNKTQFNFGVYVKVNISKISILSDEENHFKGRLTLDENLKRVLVVAVVCMYVPEFWD